MATKTSNCCTILLSELSPCQEYFSSIDSTGRRLDIEESFGPSSIPAIIAKLALAGFTFYTWISMFVNTDYRGFFFAYLTVWVLSLQVLYHMFSVWNSFSPPPGVNARIKFTWWLYNVVMHTDIIVVLLWWLTVFDPKETDITFNEIAPHSATALVALMDGLIVNRIPIRMYHWYITVLPIELAYLAWSVIHSFLEVGNPNETDQDGNDDLLYDAVDWQDDALGTAVFIIGLIVVVGPLLQLLLFTLSLYSPCCRVSRRYLADDGEQGEEYNGETHSHSFNEEMFAVAY